MPKYVKTRKDAAKQEKKPKKKMSTLDKLKRRRKELDSGDARGGKRVPKRKKRQFNSENG